MTIEPEKAEWENHKREMKQIRATNKICNIKMTKRYRLKLLKSAGGVIIESANRIHRIAKTLKGDKKRLIIKELYKIWEYETRNIGVIYSYQPIEGIHFLSLAHLETFHYMVPTKLTFDTIKYPKTALKEAKKALKREIKKLNKGITNK